MTIFPILRGAIVALCLVAAAPLLATPAAAAANPAEQYVADNIHKGLELLNNKSLSTEQRRAQFEQFLLGLADLNRIADFTLGVYRRNASPADMDSFHAAFQNYAVAVYQSYFSKYAGQTLKVTGSKEVAPTDYVVATALIDPNDHSGQPPLEVDFRVRTDKGKPVVTDFSVANLWLSIEEHDTFTAFLGQHNGNIQLLNSNLAELAKQYK